MKNYKINTTKKRIALEVIFLVVVTFVCGILFFIKEYNDKEVDVIDLKIDSLNDTYFKRRFEALDIKQELEEYSYESYKKNILNDTDSSFRKKIYNSLCSAFRYYENEKTFNEFINDFEYDSINLKDIEISILERKKNEIKDQISNTNKLCNTIIIVLLIVTYPLRYLFYLIKWAIKTLEEKEIHKETFSPKQEIIQSDSEQNIKKSKQNIDELISFQDNLNNSDPDKKNIFPLWLSLSKEYIKGSTYLWRMILGTITILFFGFGLYLMFITACKRSNSLGFKRTNSIIISIIVTLFILISSAIRLIELPIENYDENTEKYILFLGLTFFLTIPHLILIFKNGNKNINESL